MIIIICFIVINMLLNFVKYRVGYLLLGIILTVLVFILICSNGLLLRNVLRNAKDPKINEKCIDSLRLTHEDNLKKDWCQEKYLPEGQTCRKQDLSVYWEQSNKTGVTNYRSIDPSCCQQAYQFYQHPFYVLGIFALGCTVALVGCFIFDFYLSEQELRIDTLEKKFGNTEIIAMGILLLLIIVFSIWLIFFKNKDKIQQNPSAYTYQQISDKGIEDPEYTVVPDQLLKYFSTDQNLCYNYDLSTMPKAVIDPSVSCGGNNCGFRVAILAGNTKIIKPIQAGGITEGPKNARNLPVFFPADHNSNNAFLLIKGSETDINNYLSNLKFCPIKISENEPIYVNIDQLDLTKLDSRVLLTTEAIIGIVKPTPNGAIGHPTGYTPYAPTLKGDSQQFFTLNQGQATSTLKGKLMTKTEDGTKIPYSYGKVNISVWKGSEKLGDCTMTSDGIFTLPIRIFPKAGYDILLKVDDTSVTSDADYTNYEYNKILVQVPGTPVDEVSAGEILLLTRNGIYCGTNLTCWKNQSTKTGSVLVKLINGYTQEEITDESVEVVLTKWWSEENEVYAKQKISSESKQAKFTNIVYNAYIATINHDDYVSTSRRLTLQTTETSQTISLIPKKSNAVYRLVFDMPDKGVDFDLNLIVKSINGKTCEVSPMNKYCGYAKHVKQVGKEGGIEVIELNKFSISNYMSYISPSPSYIGQSCPQAVTYTRASKTPALLLDEVNSDNLGGQAYQSYQKLLKQLSLNHNTKYYNNPDKQKYIDEYIKKDAWDWNDYRKYAKNVDGDNLQVNDIGFRTRSLSTNDSLSNTKKQRAGESSVEIQNLANKSEQFVVRKNGERQDDCLAKFYYASGVNEVTAGEMLDKEYTAEEWKNLTMGLEVNPKLSQRRKAAFYFHDEALKSDVQRVLKEGVRNNKKYKQDIEKSKKDVEIYEQKMKETEKNQSASKQQIDREQKRLKEKQANLDKLLKSRVAETQTTKVVKRTITKIGADAFDDGFSSFDRTNRNRILAKAVKKTDEKKKAVLKLINDSENELKIQSTFMTKNLQKQEVDQVKQLKSEVWAKEAGQVYKATTQNFNREVEELQEITNSETYIAQLGKVARSAKLRCEASNAKNFFDYLVMDQIHNITHDIKEKCTLGYIDAEIDYEKAKDIEEKAHMAGEHHSEDKMRQFVKNSKIAMNNYFICKNHSENSSNESSDKKENLRDNLKKQSGCNEKVKDIVDNIIDKLKTNQSSSRNLIILAEELSQATNIIKEVNKNNNVKSEKFDKQVTSQKQKKLNELVKNRKFTQLQSTLAKGQEQQEKAGNLDKEDCHVKKIFNQKSDQREMDALIRGSGVAKNYADLQSEVAKGKQLIQNGKNSRIRMKKEMGMVDLANTNSNVYNYVLVSCFTGSGSASIIELNDYKEDKPDISTCEALYPSGSEYSLNNLQIAVNNYKAQSNTQ